MHHRRILIAVSAVALATALGTSPTTASPTVSDPIATGLAGPLQLDVHHHHVFVGQAFAGVLTRIDRDGSTHDLLTDPEGVIGIAIGKHSVAYTARVEGDQGLVSASLKVARPGHGARVVADLLAFETSRDPDKHNVYGFVGLSDDCTAQLPAEIGPPTYTGQIDTNPYALARAPHGGWYVADAGANAILKVSPRGHVKVVAVLRPQPAVITAEAAAANGIPDCAVGATYRFEPVPTDVEVARNGQLFVTLLPGGPEDPSLGARGSVVRINPWSHKVRTVAKGFLGATNLALGPHGQIWVAEIFGNRISKVRHGHGVPIAEVPTPAGLEYAHGRLFASIDVFGDGSVVTIRP